MHKYLVTQGMARRCPTHPSLFARFGAIALVAYASLQPAAE